ncbi:uncharacterized protein LTR77_007641 [Saxophila tyrrhenica]|uniref:Uncharacterized protein n=1 Tax=Saxophila tyrrhenica TaxID=1690608 RepID=A0AAV9P5L6_9PEZI|nr:hypothetical protein LTR77_007641 [Saxophila tyrrhenica]
MGLNSIILPLVGLVAVVTGLGCYTTPAFFAGTSDFEFSDLHNNPGRYSGDKNRDLHQEVINDIDTHCQLVSGSIVKPGSGWEDCSEWAYQKATLGCELDCNHSCIDEEGVDQYTCEQDCYAECPLEDQFPYRNHIDWEIKHDGDGDDTHTISYDSCMAGFKNIVDTMGCTLGGEQNYDGFWFRIDPNPGACGT